MADEKTPLAGGVNAGKLSQTRVLILRQLTDKVKSLLKTVLVHGYCRGLLPHLIVTLAFRRFTWLKEV